MRLSRTAAGVLGSTLLLSPLAFALPTGSDGLIGDWQEPSGSVIRVAACGKDLCLRLIGISKQAPYTMDGENPDPALRTRPLCNLEIGRGFQIKDSTHAEEGSLYDPKSGKTYKGALSSEGDTLKLRGYVGLKAFGRTETWTRKAGGELSCTRI